MMDLALWNSPLDLVFMNLIFVAAGFSLRCWLHKLEVSSAG
jgi:hypothetical protein